MMTIAQGGRKIAGKAAAWPSAKTNLIRMGPLEMLAINLSRTCSSFRN